MHCLRNQRREGARARYLIRPSWSPGIRAGPTRSTASAVGWQGSFFVRRRLM